MSLLNLLRVYEKVVIYENMNYSMVVVPRENPHQLNHNKRCTIGAA